jgi:hypothetical protein
MLDLRMLFSALVDADFLDTDAHYQGSVDGPFSRKPGPAFDAPYMLELIEKFRENVRKKSSASSSIREVRDLLWTNCQKAAEDRHGLWTLSAPTGSGKTLAMLGFALRHAKYYGHRRVITVLPFLSIIEQSANIYRQAFCPPLPDEIIIEHHSLSENEGISRLLAENWDAPLIVTTSVQFLESLFANRPGACRKLHRIAKSVILFDEVQSLPLPLIIPTLAALGHLVKHYGCTIVFSTATQPAFDHLDEEVRWRESDGGHWGVRERNTINSNPSGEGWNPHEIVADSNYLFNLARRTTVKWPIPGGNLSWDNLALLLAEHEQVLCVVNLKRHAVKLINQLQIHNVEEVRHLSTLMCPAHRRKVLSKIKTDLEQGRRCRLVSTQCVEAGVDLDFPVVYRAMGPLEAIAQAAGRCNRESKLDTGNVVVFFPRSDEDLLCPTGIYQQATDITVALLTERGSDAMDINNPSLFSLYYQRLFALTGTHFGSRELFNAIVGWSPEDVARLYKVIAEDTICILTPYEPEIYEKLLAEGRDQGINRSWIRRAQLHTVQLYRPNPDNLFWQNLEPLRLHWESKSGSELTEAKRVWFALRSKKYYDQLLGLKIEDLGTT